jgi:hypothetical protein
MRSIKALAVVVVFLIGLMGDGPALADWCIQIDQGG